MEHGQQVTSALGVAGDDPGAHVHDDAAMKQNFRRGKSYGARANFPLTTQLPQRNSLSLITEARSGERTEPLGQFATSPRPAEAFIGDNQPPLALVASRSGHAVAYRHASTHNPIIRLDVVEHAALQRASR